ncbi:M15 family metallopeptidase [Promicromonospora sp. MEB111]|uniref:M15 family metallopeptidase n=1 Tax=Promicromonospora sp. MEB111 TaxID=3040301 RepID=UPI00254C03BF|nr:M15 family metallopeptidase [Promicromonospora sp. MEB111]
MQEQANELVSPVYGPDRRRVLRTTWAGAIATVTAGGLLFAAAPAVPGTHGPGDGRDRAARHQGLIEAAPAARTGTTPRHVTPEQITAVLARADEQARRDGPDLSPAVAQAAAELGMLYTTYLMQELAFGESTDGLRVQDAPVARAVRDDDGAGTTSVTEARAAAIPVSDEHGAVPPAAEPEGEPGATSAEAVLEATSAGEADLPSGRITYHQVVLAAVRLANLLDPSVASTLVEVEATGEDQESSGGTDDALGAHDHAVSTLRESLLDVVSAFGTSTLEYANGRIPADVLCPLDFAPSHLLRCDAAERLAALNGEFEEEFGHPIPITDSYRSYVQQVAVAGAKPHLAAVPGTSNHGWGLAVDLGAPISGGRSPEYVWLRVHGPDYGWDNPSWARLDGAKPEPWHFEFFAAGSVPNRAIDPSDVGRWTSGDASEDDGPRYEAAADARSTDRPAAEKPRKPVAMPPDEPREPGTKQPAKPGPKPKPSDPAPKPSPRPTDPSPKPTPSPTPSDPGVPSPSPTPSQPAPSPTPTPTPTPTPSDPMPTPSAPETSPSPAAEATPSGSETPTSPVPSSSPSTTRDSLLGLAEELGLTDD